MNRAETEPSRTLESSVQIKPKHRRARGSGSVYRLGRVWWIAYRGPDGRRVKESTGSERKSDAERLLQARNGSRVHHLPMVKNAERLTFREAAKAMLDDYAVNHPHSLKKLDGRIRRHLMPHFGHWKLASITTTDILAFVSARQKEGIVAHAGPRKGERVGDVSNAEINRELQTLKRIFSLAIEHDRIAMRPTIKLPKESDARSGFFERGQYEAVLKNLPTEIRPVIQFAYHTGWRIASEVLPLEWRNVDLTTGEVRLDAGSTKNGDGRVIHLSTDLRLVLETQYIEHERLKKAGHIFPRVFFREVAEGRGGAKKPQPITSFHKVWKMACCAAGCPGRIPHDLRRTAVRNFIRSGIPERVAMRMTGHKTASVFARYNIVSDGDLREAAEKMNAAAALRTGDVGDRERGATR